MTAKVQLGGLIIHNNTVWIYMAMQVICQGGKKWITVRMFWDYEWVRTSTLLNDNTWYNETKIY